jgi:protein subunit release factor A
LTLTKTAISLFLCQKSFTFEAGVWKTCETFQTHTKGRVHTGLGSLQWFVTRK